jgi:hypothetical protein
MSLVTPADVRLLIDSNLADIDLQKIIEIGRAHV